jgi:hypothetical protein
VQFAPQAALQRPFDPNAFLPMWRNDWSGRF